MPAGKYGMRPKDEWRFMKSSNYATQIIGGNSIEKIAKDEKITLEDALKVLEELKNVNPFLYQQLMDKVKENEKADEK